MVKSFELLSTVPLCQTMKSRYSYNNRFILHHNVGVACGYDGNSRKRRFGVTGCVDKIAVPGDTTIKSSSQLQESLQGKRCKVEPKMVCLQQNANILAQNISPNNRHNGGNRESGINQRLLRIANNSCYNNVAAGGSCVVAGETLPSYSTRYQVLESLGRGSFGEVFRCWKKGTNELAAIKIVKKKASSETQINNEVAIMHQLRNERAHQFNIVCMHEFFNYRKQICMVFETLQISLYDYLEEINCAVMPLYSIRIITLQVLVALKKLKELQIIHADLKAENILLVDPVRQPLRVKVIDFGLSLHTNETTPGMIVGTTEYISPEILIGHDFCEKTDMWSLGCVIAELFLGFQLFPGSCDYDQLRFIVQTLGMIPEHILKNGVRSREFFKVARTNHISEKWHLKPPNEYRRQIGVKSKETRICIMRRIDDITRINHPPTRRRVRHFLSASMYNQEVRDRFEFLALLREMLALDHRHRVDPNTALKHAFIMVENLKTVETKRPFETICPSSSTNLKIVQQQSNQFDSNIPAIIPNSSDNATTSVAADILTASPCKNSERLDTKRLHNIRRELPTNLPSTRISGTDEILQRQAAASVSHVPEFRARGRKRKHPIKYDKQNDYIKGEEVLK